MSVQRDYPIKRGILPINCGVIITMKKDIRSLGKKKVSLTEIEKFYGMEDYKILYDKIIELLDVGIIEVVKSSKPNGKSPALRTAYRVMPIGEDNTELTNELRYAMDMKLDTSYYLRNIAAYKGDRAEVLKLNTYLLHHGDKLKNRISINERSFEIWGREKFLSIEGGVRILRNLGLAEGHLNYYATAIPLAYYSHSKQIPQNVLILENKDTFYSMRKHLLEGSHDIFKTEISTLVYGGGKNINKSFGDFNICVEPYIANADNTILYFGDLDYEGIIIYESLKREIAGEHTLQPFIEGYTAMIDKYLRMDMSLPKTKAGQNRNISELFLREFNDEYREAIVSILERDEYIPQEILNIGDF